jgi:hypothetical protein
MMRRIKRFEPLSVMKISAICHAVLGLIEGAFFSVFFYTLVPGMPNMERLPHGFALFFSGFAIVLFPILFAVMGAIVGGLGAAIYNVSARFVGGIEVEVE